MSPKFYVQLVLLTVVSLATPGCGSKGDGYTGPRGKVTGTATIDGKPLQKDCQIIFISVTGAYTATGVIGEGGAYTLNYADDRGIPAVEYQIQFTAPVTVPPTAAAPIDPTKMAESMKVGQKMKVGNEGPIPTKYQSTISSKMSFTVKDGENKADFDLKTGG